jgi:hypothetical protein
MPSDANDGHSSERSRRWFLRAAAPAIVAAVAGCSGDGDDGSPTPRTATRTATPTLTPTLTPTTVGSPTPTATTTPTDTPTETDTPTADPATLARTLIERLDAEAYEVATERFGEQLSQRLPPLALENFWKSQTWIVGGYAGVRSTSVEALDGATGVTAVVEGEYGLLSVRVAVSDGVIVGLNATPRAEGSYSPPAYADRDAFEERSRTVAPDSDCPLPATLSVPTGRSGPVPGVVLVHGSGPQDRNSTVGPQQPFKDLAWGLASRGIAVLRYRKRTAECELAPAEATLDRIAVDAAVSAVDLLREEDAVAADRVAVLGLSQGGMAAPRIAERSGNVAALGLLGAPGRHVWRVQYDQNRAVFAFDGEVDDDEQSQLDQYRLAGGQVENGGLPPGRTVLGRPGAFWNSVADYDQVAVAAGLDLPVAVLQGERDVQVSPEADFEAWREGLSGSPGATFRLYSPCNHLFLPGSGPSYVGRYYTEPDNVAETVVADLAEWLPATMG